MGDEKPMVPQWVKVTGFLSGVVGAVLVPATAGLSLAACIAAGAAAFGGGLSALYATAPKNLLRRTGVKGGAKGQAVDDEEP